MKDLEKRYRFLLGFLIEHKILTNKRYSNGTWVLRGVYGVDDSGIKGAGRGPEEAVDNAIVANALDPISRDRFWNATHEALAGQAADLAVSQQEIARLRAALERAVSFVEHAEVSSGVCCCGDSMAGHANPMYCGHLPRDMWDYAAEGFIKETRTLLNT